MKHLGTTVLLDNVTRLHEYQYRCRIYTDEINMATNDDLQAIDDRIFIRDLEFRKNQKIKRDNVLNKA